MNAVPGAPGQWRALLLLGIIYALNYADRQVLAVLAEPIKREMLLTDAQLSLLTGTLFALFYSVLSVPIAFWADRVSRVRIIGVACFLWSLFTGLSGLAASFVQLAVARVGVAVGEAGGAAPSISLISDLFDRKSRVRALSLFTAASPVGILLGTMGGGMIAAWFDWRTALLCLSVVGLVAAPLLVLLVKEPVRGQFEDPGQAGLAPQSFTTTLGEFFRRPSLRWLLIAMGFYSAAGNAVLAWTPALLIRQYDARLGDVATYYGLVVSISFFLSLVGSGLILERLLRRSERAYVLLPAACMVICGPLFVVALMMHSWAMVVAMLFIPLLLLNSLMNPALALVQELSAPQARATATSLLLLALNLVGMGLGPLIVGLASDALHPFVGEESLFWTLIILVPLETALCALCLLACSRHVPKELVSFRAA